MGELGGWLEATDPTGKSGSELLNDKKKKFAKLVGGWLTSKLAGILTEKNMTIVDCKITPEDFAEFIHLLDAGEINSANAQKLLLLMVETGTDPSHIMEEHDLGQNMPDHELEEIIKTIVRENPDQVAQVKSGKLGVLKWFVGATMKATEGKANPAKAEEITKKEIGV
jgi:aspartyl-tRNA(Asn)/glutamyl-tRNA(Gln) amidotransferase subunit B